MAKSNFGKSTVTVKVEPNGVENFVKQNKPFRDMLAKMAADVQAEAAATADSAQRGAGGRLDGYAQAGFSIKWITKGKRPQVQIHSNADSKTATAAHFYTQKRDGVAHLRAALYKFTRRGKR